MKILVLVDLATHAVVPREPTGEMLEAGAWHLKDNSMSPRETLIGGAYKAMIAAATPPDVQGWQPTHRHADGGLYRKIGLARIKNYEGWLEGTLYENAGGEMFVRTELDFSERFSPLPPPPTQENPK